MTARIAAVLERAARQSFDSPERFKKLTAMIRVNGKPLEQMPPATVRERENGK